MRGFQRNIRYSNILCAEILGLMHGIDISWDEGLRHIIFYVDYAYYSSGNRRLMTIKSL
jgi:hypothetical protein